MKTRSAFRASIGRKYAPGGLAEQLAMLPTPRTAAARDSMHDRGKSNLGEIVGENIGLKLQPAFVEWMMGYPEGWTELPASKLSEMRLSRKSRKK